jgi:tetratricopeptide (TPR) repeat protein
LVQHCVECHRPDGGAPFSLLTFDEAKRRASQIADVTARHYMPPWKPIAGRGGPFTGERRLTDQQIETIARWVDRGAPEGTPTDPPALDVRPEGWRLGTPDLVVQMSQPYLMPAEGPDVFRNFAVPMPVSVTRCVRGLEFRPGNRAVHHANMMVDRTLTSRRFDDQDPEPGYDGPIAPDAEYPDGHFLGWTPGQAPPLLPEDMCWRLEAGSDLLLQMHLRPTGKPEAVQPVLAFFFSDRPATRIPVMLRLGRQDLDIPAGERSYRVSDAYVVPVDIEVQAVQPHAHYLAREVRAFAHLPDGTIRWLVHIADWDFQWQDVYRYASPFWLPSGTRLVMEYTYDNSAENLRNPHHPPRRVSWGQRTTDEMGDLWIQVLARDDDARVRLTRGARDKALREDIVGYSTMLRANPGDAALHESLAKSHLQVGQVDEALRHAEEFVRLEPGSAAGRYNLGTALAAKNRRAEAVVQFTEAVRLDPALAYAQNSLGVALHALGRVDEAVVHFRRAIEIEPAYAIAHNNLGRALELQGELQDAIIHYREAIRIQPDNAQTQQNLGGALVLAGRIGEAVGHYRRALELRPDSPVVAGRLAWILATHVDAGVRNPEEAIRWAERAAIVTDRRDADVLDVLGAAYASGGRFDDAVAAAQAALDLALRTGADELAGQIRGRIALYRQRQAYREAPTGGKAERF